MKLVTSHIMGIRLQDLNLLGLQYSNVPNTTLNELFGVQAGVAVDPGKYPDMAYLAIGNGGHTVATTADGLAYPQLKNHDPQDCALISHLPFVLCLPNEDLSPAVQSNYGMRTPVTINGINYIAYYLRKLDLTNTQVQMLLNTVNNGVTSSVPWVPNSGNLHPTGAIPPSTGVVVTSGQYVSVQAVVQVALADADIQNLMNVAQILYGNTGLAIISEMALVAAQPKLITAQQQGSGTLTYTEAVGAIICSSMSAFYHLPSLNDSLTLAFDVGGAESLYGVGTTPSPSPSPTPTAPTPSPTPTP